MAAATAGAPIYVVDDDPAMRGFIGRTITATGHAVVEFERASDVIAALASEKPPALLVTDATLGRGMTGLELANEARRINRDLPVLVLTGGSIDCIHPHVTAVLEMPYATAALRAVVEWCLQRWSDENRIVGEVDFPAPSRPDDRREGLLS